MDNAFEGKTVRLIPPCPLCQGPMEPGYTLDRDVSGGGVHESEWAAGTPNKRHPWIGGVTTKGVRRYVIVTFRCEQCGYLASFASERRT